MPSLPYTLPVASAESADEAIRKITHLHVDEMTEDLAYTHHLGVTDPESILLKSDNWYYFIPGRAAVRMKLWFENLRREPQAELAKEKEEMLQTMSALEANLERQDSEIAATSSQYNVQSPAPVSTLGRREHSQNFGTPHSTSGGGGGVALFPRQGTDQRQTEEDSSSDMEDRCLPLPSEFEEQAISQLAWYCTFAAFTSGVEIEKVVTPANTGCMLPTEDIATLERLPGVALADLRQLLTDEELVLLGNLFFYAASDDGDEAESSEDDEENDGEEGLKFLCFLIEQGCQGVIPGREDLTEELKAEDSLGTFTQNVLRLRQLYRPLELSNRAAKLLELADFLQFDDLLVLLASQFALVLDATAVKGSSSKEMWKGSGSKTSTGQASLRAPYPLMKAEVETTDTHVNKMAKALGVGVAQSKSGDVWGATLSPSYQELLLTEEKWSS